MSLSKQSTKPKYCKVCHDSGKDEKTYTSHYVRETPDPSSRIVCPTLLNLECKYCYKKGHTVKFCKAIKNRAHNKEKREVTKVPPALKETETKNANKKSNNMYDLLESDDDFKVEETILPRPPHILSTSASSVAPLNYSKIIEVTNKQVVEEEKARAMKETGATRAELQAKDSQPLIMPRQPLAMPSQPSLMPSQHLFGRGMMLNWADDTSDEEDNLEV